MVKKPLEDFLKSSKHSWIKYFFLTNINYFILKREISISYNQDCSLLITLSYVDDAAHCPHVVIVIRYSVNFMTHYFITGNPDKSLIMKPDFFD